MDELTSANSRLGEDLASLSSVQRAELVLASARASEMRFSVLEAVGYYADYIANSPVAEKFNEAIDLFLKEREAQIGHASFKNLRSVIRRWEAATNARLVVELDKTIIKNWLDSLTDKTGQKPARARTKNGYLTEIKNFLNWAKENHIVGKNVGDEIQTFKPSIDELKEVEAEAQILTPKEVRKVMDWIVENRPDMTPRAAALFFAGLRPDREASLFDWGHVDFEENLLFVPAAHAKDRQRRYIEMNPTLVAWLKFAKDQPTPVTNWDNGWNQAKKVLGFWPHDAARHCFASYSLPVDGKEKVIQNLGHGDYDMLFKHYRTVVKPKKAAEYWGVLPIVQKINN